MHALATVFPHAPDGGVYRVTWDPFPGLLEVTNSEPVPARENAMRGFLKACFDTEFWCADGVKDVSTTCRVPGNRNVSAFDVTPLTTTAACATCLDPAFQKVACERALALLVPDNPMVAHDIAAVQRALQATPSPPRCAACGEVLVVRTSRRGNRFWGCTAFPRCQYTHPIAAPIIRVDDGDDAPPRPNPIAAQIAQTAATMPTRTEAERCVRIGCRTARTPGRSFCAAHDPGTAPASTPPHQAAQGPAPHATHAIDGRTCRVCHAIGDALRKPCKARGRGGMIELD